MEKTNYDSLNELEKKIYEVAILEITNNPNISIVHLATICNVSTSKISKFVKKLGFSSYKQFKTFVSGEIIVENNLSSELRRIQDYLLNFDDQLVYSFYNQLVKFQKVVIFGLGPSFICAEYFAHRLRIFSDIFVIATNEQTIVQNSARNDTLLIILSTTGQFKRFDSLVNDIEYGDVMFLFEEFRMFEELQKHTIFYLTEGKQADNLMPYEKTRTIFFIFLEEVIQQFIE